jgi:transglutaminase-like putative cysteine protease
MSALDSLNAGVAGLRDRARPDTDTAGIDVLSAAAPALAALGIEAGGSTWLMLWSANDARRTPSTASQAESRPAGDPIAARQETRMQIQLGYELVYACPQPTPMILALNVHFSRVSDLLMPDHIVTRPPAPLTAYRDGFGNWCSRVVAPPGDFGISANAHINDCGLPDVVEPAAQQIPVEQLPGETLVFLLGSRYCETDRLSETAWSLFGQTPPGWARVQAVCDWVHNQISFGYQHARVTKTALETLQERTGVCRDFTHLAVAFCRCLNIPARYCTGYLGDIGVPPSADPMDFSAWMEVYLGGQWYTFDPRNNAPRIGRVLIARGRDAADVAISTAFGPTELKSFRVWTDQVGG